MKSKYLITVLMVAIIISGVAYGFFFYELSKVNAEASAVRQEIENEDEREARLKLIEKELEKTVLERQKIENLFVGKDGAISFIEKLESLAKESGVSLSIDSLNVETASMGYERLRGRIRASGSWKETYHFMALVESMPLSIIWSRASFGIGGDDENEGAWIFSADMEVLKIK